MDDDLGVWQESQDPRLDFVRDGMRPGERQVVIELDMELDESQATGTPRSKVMDPEHVRMLSRDR